MDEIELREALAKAGNQDDGHVTHGSLKAQMRVVLEAIGEVSLESSASELEVKGRYAYLAKLGREAKC